MSDPAEQAPKNEVDDSPLSPEMDVAMSIWEHLDEFRKRLVNAAIAVMITSILCWVYKEQILAALSAPYIQQWHLANMPGEPELQSVAMAGTFTSYMRQSLTCGIILSVPVIFYQLWAFISPGLYAKEKRFIVPFVLFSSFLFLSGVAFAYKIAFPFSTQYFFSLAGKVGSSGLVVTQRPTFDEFLDFTTTLHLIFGGIFELPILIMFLVIAGIVTRPQLWKFSRWAVFASIALGAIVTPGGDVMFQMLVAGALSALYFTSILLSYLVANVKKAPSP